ncbi:Tripartite DNA replication factor [Xylographa trunciseda]|nr:Tripartite DNA replication factor [Xylographa trunciseda]
MSAPAITASSQSRTKLKAFQFAGNGSAASENDIYGGDEEHENKSTGQSKTRKGSQKRPKSSSREATDIKNNLHAAFPATPIGRVPLAELISNGEDTFDQLPLLTPVERILWNHSQSSTDLTSNFATPFTRRGTKRARSSSPHNSSPEEEAGVSLCPRNSAPFNTQTLQKSLMSPHADPAKDLWSRYSLHPESKQTPSKAPALSLSNLLHTSSPQTPVRNVKGLDNSGLRRSLSCGVEWPTSAAKRRKIQKSLSQIGDRNSDASRDEIANPQRDSKASRVNFLLEKIHDGLAESWDQPKVARRPSSSPPALAQAQNMAFPSSPIQWPRTDVAQDSQSRVRLGPNTATRAKVDKSRNHIEHLELFKEEAIVTDEKASSDYGDDGFDEGLLNEVDATIRTAALPADPAESSVDVVAMQSLKPEGKTCKSFGPSAGHERSVTEIDMSTSACGPPSDPPILPPIATTEKYAEHELMSNQDEFDDEYDELFGEGLVSLAAEFDQQTPPNAANRFSTSQLQAHDLPVEGDLTTTVLPKMEEIVDLVSDDEFGAGFEFEDIAEDFARATQAADVSATINDRKLPTIQRYLIVTIATSHYPTSNGQTRPEKVMLVVDEKSKNNKVVILRQSWFDSPCTPGSYIHVLGAFDKNGQCVVDDTHHILILHPDHLISATVVADSFSCTRRAVLQARVKATNEANEPQVYGHILHEIFQEALKANRWDTSWLAHTIRVIASRYLETLFEINVDMTNAVDHLTSKVPELQSWAEVFVTAQPRPEAVVKDRNGAQALMSINKLLDVEEHVWSPMYGLKGNIDATVQVVMRDGNGQRILTVPLEVKTGKNNSNAAHKAQTALYTLLLSDRYDVQIAYGILYYMETSEMSRIPAIRHELRHMIMQRNELACYVRQRLELPPMLKSPHLCGHCYAKTPCFVYHKLMDNGDGNTSGMNEKFDKLVNHLTPIHQDFFKKWDDLLTKEEADVLKFRRELWTMLSSEREKVGRCFGSVVIEPGSAVELVDAPKINRFRYSFVKERAQPAFSFADSQITIGEPIVISDEKGHFALANGYVTHLRKHRITVAVDRRLHNTRVRGKDFDDEINQAFSGVMEVVRIGDHQSTMTPQEPEIQVLYRLDKDEFSNGMATVRNNLIRIMELDLFGAQALRKLIVEGVAPTFLSAAPMTFNTASQSSLNVDQRNAIEKVMCARDYALVLGMPGTGKTTTIAHIIRALTAQGKTVLLTSYTHTAVDNILLKIQNDGIGILRLGALAKVHPQVQEFADLAAVPKTTVEELAKSYSNQVVATTCLSINHPIFNQRIFDYCIVDEASQITLPVCLGPIRMARTFILVGDHYQLPPLVQNKEAQEGGLDISLFKLLSEKHPSSVVNLEHQYRMCEDIMTLSNTLIYDGRLKCGTAKVANSKIIIPDMPGLRVHHHTASTIPSTSSIVCPAAIPGACWIRDLLDPAVKVAFVNTDHMIPLSREIAKGSRITNPVEATVVTQLVGSLLATGVNATDIGVITLYRSQLALLKQTLRQKSSTLNNIPGDIASGVEMHTADRFQGRDKEVVVLSLVRSNETGNVGDLLKDWRRVNVALTRARTKLLIVGSWDTMKKGSELLSKFCTLIDEKGWKVDLRKNALEMHLFEDLVTQGSVKVRENEPSEQRTARPRQENRTTVRGAIGKQRVPEKKGTMDVRKLLGNRPVMRDIVNDALAREE